MLGIKTANTELHQRKNSFFLEVSPLLTWGMLPVNSVGGAEGRGQNQAPFICCQSRVGVLSALVLSPRGLSMRNSAQDQALHTLDAPTPLTCMSTQKCWLFQPQREGWLNQFNKARNHLILFFFICLSQKTLLAIARLFSGSNLRISRTLSQCSQSVWK